MFERTPLSHAISGTMQMGRLKVIDWIPVSAGDKVEANYNTFWRMSPTRYPLRTAMCVEYAGFYMPYRQLIGSAQTATYRTPAAWEQEAIRVTKGDASGISNIRDNLITAAGAAGIEHPLAGLGLNGEVGVREHIGNFYLDVINDYFRNEQYHRAYNTGRWRQRYEASGANNWESVNGLVTTTTEIQRMMADRDYSLFGKIICNLPDSFTRPITAYNPALGNVATTSDQLNLIKLNQQRVLFRREVDQSINYREYGKFLRHVWNGSIADEQMYKPKVLFAQKHWQDSFDIDATDGANLGQITGKSVQSGNFGFPRWFAPEHGLIMVCAWARFPLMLEKAKNRLVNANLADFETFREIIADPAWYANQPPQEWKVSDFIHGGADSGTGFSFPYGHSYRSEHAKIGPLWATRDVGFPVVSDNNASARNLIECPVDQWAKIFRSDRLEHLQYEIQAEKYRYTAIPGGAQSIYAGAQAG